jgi:hypothetical protein
MTTNELINLVAQLAQDVDAEDPVDFGMLRVDDDSVWHTMAANVIEAYLPQSDDKIVIMAVITKLIVENFVLNARLRNEFN